MTKKKKDDVKKIDDEFILANCEVIVIFPNYGQLGAIQKPYSGRIVCKTNIFLTVTFYLTKTENSTKQFLTQLTPYSFK